MALGPNHVPVEPLAVYFARGVERGDFTAADIAERLGWTRASKYRRGWHADGPRVLRALGLKSYRPREGGDRIQRHLRYEKAVLLCRALGADPIDMGL